MHAAYIRPFQVHVRGDARGRLHDALVRPEQAHRHFDFVHANPVERTGDARSGFVGDIGHVADDVGLHGYSHERGGVMKTTNKGQGLQTRWSHHDPNQEFTSSLPAPRARPPTTWTSGRPADVATGSRADRS